MSTPSLRDLPDWVKSLGLPKSAVDAIDRYWKPVWDEIVEQLELLPDHRGRAPEGLPRPAGDWMAFEAVRELEPGERWKASFDAMWPAYRSWYLKEGQGARPSQAECRRMLRRHMPELMPIYERLVNLTGGDELAARFLSLYRPPGFVVGCTQGAWTGAGGPALVRNYDYPASKAEGIVYLSGWSGRRVIGMSDCLWGLLDGVNDAGLAASLTFGGRRAVGDGFGIPLVIRYVLETCETVAEARETLARVPVHAAQNVTVVDAAGDLLTACVGPDREPDFRDVPAATNHQRANDWPEYATAVRTIERERVVLELLRSPDMTRKRFVQAFLEPPLRSTAYARGFGTLYTAAYHPAEGRVEYRWPGFTWSQSFEDFTEGSHERHFDEGRRAAHGHQGQSVPL
jgi:predicted choloylglycine hydrolase